MSSIKVRKLRSKKKITYKLPVLIISRSNKNILAQILEPVTKNTLFTVTSNNLIEGSKTDKAELVGAKISEILKKEKISKLVFDRNGLIYHGRVQKLVDTIRKNNIDI